MRDNGSGGNAGGSVNCFIAVSCFAYNPEWLVIDFSGGDFYMANSGGGFVCLGGFLRKVR